MHRIEMTDIDQRIAQVCDPATAGRYNVLYHRGGERWLVARVLPSDLDRFIESLKGQGGEVVVYQQERSEWTLMRWLRRYKPDAPMSIIEGQLRRLGAPTY